MLNEKLIWKLTWNQWLEFLKFGQHVATLQNKVGSESSGWPPPTPKPLNLSISSSPISTWIANDCIPAAQGSAFTLLGFHWESPSPPQESMYVQTISIVCDLCGYYNVFWLLSSAFGLKILGILPGTEKICLQLEDCTEQITVEGTYIPGVQRFKCRWTA